MGQAASPQPSILVVGGGIGGLTTAIALRRIKISADVVEQAPALAAVGAGITIQINGAAIFDALQIVLPPEDSCSIGCFEMVNQHDRVLMSGNVEELDLGFPSLNLHRADLQQALLRSLEAAGGQLQLGRRVVSLSQPGGPAAAVRVDFADGTSGDWDLVIGVDGMRSTVREALLGEGSTRLRYSGQTCWRFAVTAPALVPEVTVERWGPGRRVGIVPMSRDRIYVYMVESAPEGTPGPDTATVAALRARFADVDDRLGPIFACLEAQAAAGQPVAIHHGDLCDQPQISFGQGRVLLLGDAAHGSTPNMGQGANTAIEDAAALALILSSQPGQIDGLPAALAKRQHDRVRQIQKTSRLIGAMAHAQGALTRWLRDRLLGAIPDVISIRQARDLYSPGLRLADELRAVLAP